MVDMGRLRRAAESLPQRGMSRDNRAARNATARPRGSTTHRDGRPAAYALDRRHVIAPFWAIVCHQFVVVGVPPVRNWHSPSLI
jgi:hypothetical protein